jgi:hypothetical protein
LFMDTAAGTLDGGGQAQRQFQRIEVRAFGIIKAGLIALAGHPIRQLLAGNELQAVVTPLVTGFALPFGQQADPARHDRSPQVPGPIVAVEAMTPGQFTQLPGGPAHAVPQAPGTFITQAASSGGMSHDQPRMACPPLRPDAAHATRLASSVTRLPANARRSAVCSPLKPAPMITISVSWSPTSAGRVVRRLAQL